MGTSNDSVTYELEVDADSKLTAVTLVTPDERRAISIDPTSSDYSKFATWASEQQSAVAWTYERLPRGGRYFCSEADLIAYCKANAIVLYASEGQDGLGKLAVRPQSLPPFFRIDIPIFHGCEIPNGKERSGIFFYQLDQAVPSPAGSWAAQNTAPFMQDELRVYISHTLLEKLERDLHDPDSNIRKVSSWSVEKTFVYADVSDYSKHNPAEQLLIINTLIRLTTDEFWRGPVPYEVKQDLEASLCIGDGYIFVFRAAHTATFFAAYLASLIEQLIALGRIIEFHFRIGVHTGPVYRFWDPAVGGGGRWNYVGKGIIDGQRVLSSIGKDKDDIVFISSHTRTAILRVASGPYQAAEWLQNRGRQADKHGQLRRVYEVNHTGWTTKYLSV